MPAPSKRDRQNARKFVRNRGLRTRLRNLSKDFYKAVNRGDLENAERLRRLLSHHVVPQRLDPDSLNPGTTFETLAGTSLRIEEGETLLIGSAKMLQPGLEVPNGYVHKIASVLQPPEPA